MEFLPSEDERGELLRRLADVIALGGWQRFVTTPLLLPDVSFFPDKWSPDAAGVHRLAKRLLLYAGLSEFGVDIVEFETDSADGDYHSDVAGFFAGILDGRCRFGVHERHTTDDDAVVGVMCHEVAHAFRHARGLVMEDRDIEEENTDVTTIYLGFGVLAANNAYRFRTSGEMHGIYAVSKWSESRIGYLSPQAMCFLLAAQVVARGEDKRMRQAIGHALEANQEAFFKASVKSLEPDVTQVRATLGLPNESEWPARVDAAALTAPLVDDAPVVKRKKKKKKRKRNRGEPTFRVIRTGSITGAVVGVGLGALIPALAQIVEAIIPGALVGAMVGWIAGRKWRSDFCSDPACEAILPFGVERCPKCGGEIVGEIKKASERLEALERIEDERDRG